MICGGVTMWAAEASGNLVIYSESSQPRQKSLLADPGPDFSVILYGGLGYTGSIPLLLSAVYVTYAAVLNFICALMLDRVGRVRLMCMFSTKALLSQRD